MSLDVYLTDASGKHVFDANITHNLNIMAGEAGIYECLWRPEEIGITHAKQLIEPLEKGLALMVTNRTRFESFDSPNGWGKWVDFVPWISTYLQACRDYPEATIKVSR